MNEQTPQRSQQQGPYGKRDDCPPPPPPPPACPDPCGEPPRYGPPQIRPECCPDDRPCCPDDTHTACSWDEVDDPCVRAVSAECGGAWTKITCKCESSNKECNCDEWDCGCPPGTCVPCKPCDGLLPPTGDDPGACDDPERHGCDSEELRHQLDALNRCISSQEGEKAKIDAEIAARKDRADKLDALIKDFDGIVAKYKTERHKLTCREDCLKGFYRETTKVFEKAYLFPEECLRDLEKAINAELCVLEKARCCQKNLEMKLAKDTRLICEEKDALSELTRATDAFAALKDLPGWIAKQFDTLEKWKTQIADVLNDPDPQKRNYAFYLFYWKFVPGLCGRFRVAICCKEHESPAPPPASAEQYHHQPPPQPPQPEPPAHIGCARGDWHPSVITVETLKQLICCAWDYVREKEQAQRDKAAAHQLVDRNLTFIKAKVTADQGTLEDRIKAKVEKVKCAPCMKR